MALSCSKLGQQGNVKVLHVAYADLRYCVSKKIPIAFHNGSNYDFYFIIKKFIKTKCKCGYDDKKCEICVTVF